MNPQFFDPPSRALRKHLSTLVPTCGEIAPQGEFSQLGTPLSDCCFLVVDLETTGMGAGAEITEIAAARYYQRRLCGTFRSLVQTRRPIPPKIVALTGITNSMVLAADPLEEVFPRFLAFWRADHPDSPPVNALVAHNASFDTGFLRRAAEQLDDPLPDALTVDTLAIARLLLPRPFVANHRLATLASYFGADKPTHRALDDVLATVTVLQGLLDLGAGAGLTHTQDFRVLQKVPRQIRAKRVLGADLPARPGVYIFEDADGKPLYVGSASNLRTRVGSYTTLSEKRRQMREMLAAARHIQHICFPHVLLARLKELELIARLNPPFNRASTHPDKYWLLELTNEDFPRLKLSKRVERKNASRTFGPFTTRKSAERVRRVLSQQWNLRTCTQVISPGDPANSCYLEQLATCRAPCRVQNQESYRQHCQQLAANRIDAEQTAVTTLLEKVQDLADRQEFEQAAVVREQLAALSQAGAEQELLSPLLAAEKLIFALPASSGGWVYLALAYGKIVGTAFTCANAPKIAVEKTVATLAEVFPVTAPRFLAQGILWEQLHILAQQLYQPGTRIVQISDSTELVCPVSGMLARSQLRQKLAQAQKPFSFRR
ncbi:MAG: DEDD exonuclease domain-containing protein [Varibaculum cambriense]|uniref:DEDD exonuclease domain-containing protein n=1 Tax=Varibaculum cambriense TaxID=184870 RepID=UPI00241EA360|nr:DEDD exonuclease domain-containing protein [Varibaculum cambriense]MBS6618768.1 DEDD exonuclease domain-containing protein [Varibaculum cambriense]